MTASLIKAPFSAACFAALAFGSPALLAQTAAQPAQSAAVQVVQAEGAAGLSLAQALDKARQYEARYLAAQASFRAEREILPQARALLLPEVNFSYSRNRNSLDTQFGAQQAPRLEYFSGSTALNIRQPLYRPESFARFRQAKSEVTRLESVLVSERNRLSVEVTGAYLELLRAQAEYFSLQAQQRFLTTQASAAQRALPLGLSSQNERDEKLSRANLAKLRALQLQGRMTEAQRRLENMVGQPVTAVLSPQAAQIDANVLLADSLAVWQDKAQSQSPEVRAAVAAVEVARQGIDRAQAGHYPTLDAVAGRSKSTSESFNSVNNIYNNTFYGIQLNVPLYAGGRYDSGVRQAVAQHERAQAQLDGVRRESRLLVEREYLTLEIAAQRLQAFEDALRVAQQNVQSAQSGLARGVNSQVDVLETSAQLENTRYERLSARLELLIAHIRLQAQADEVDELAVARLDRWLTTPVSLAP